MVATLVSYIPPICVVRVGQHAGNKAVCCGKPLDDLEAVSLVDSEAHLNTSADLSSPVSPSCISFNALSEFLT